MNQVNNVPGAAEVAASLLHTWQSQIERGIATMQAEGEASGDIDAHRMAGALIAGIQGGVVALGTTGRTEHLGRRSTS